MARTVFSRPGGRALAAGVVAALAATLLARGGWLPHAIAAPARAASGEPAPDPRLEQRVTFEATGEPIETILPRLSKQTGVSFTFEGQNVGDRKAILLVKDLPLKELKAALAATFFGFRWQEPKPKKDQPRGYVLIQDLRARKIESDLQSFQEQQRARRLRQLLEGLRNDGRDLDPEGQQLVRDPLTRSTLETLAHLSSGQISRLRAGRPLDLALGDVTFTPAQEEEWSKQVGMKFEGFRLRESSNRDIVSVDDLKDAPPAPIRDLPNLEFGLYQREVEDGAAALHLVLRSSMFQHKFPGEVLAGATIPLSKTDDDDGAAAIEDVRKFLDLASPRDRPAQSQPPPGKDPELDRRIVRLTPEMEKALAQPPLNELYGPYWARWLVRLAKRAGLSVVSDHFTTRPSYIPKELTGLTLREAFGEADRIFQRRVVKQGPIYSFRHRRWYQMTKLEPPARVVEPLKSAFKQKGRLDIEDLALGGELTPQQVSRATNLGLPYFWIFRDNNITMRFLHALTPIQRRLAQASGVTQAMLPDAAAREWYQTAAWNVAPKLDGAELRRTVFTIRSDVDAKNTLTILFQWRRPRLEVGAEQVRLVAGDIGR